MTQLGFLCSAACGIFVPQPGVEAHALCIRNAVLTNGLPGKSQNFIYLKVKDEEKPGQPYIVGASVNWYNDFGNLPQYFLQLNIHVPLTSSSPPEYVANGNECFYPPEGMCEHVHSSCLHDHPLWKQLRSPAAVEGEIHCDVSIQ